MRAAGCDRGEPINGGQAEGHVYRKHEREESDGFECGRGKEGKTEENLVRLKR